MSIDNLVKRNISKYDPGFLQQNSLLDVDRKQCELTAVLISPHQDELIAEAIVLRQHVDHLIRKDQSARTYHRKARYPKGFCREITTTFFELLLSKLLDRSFVGFAIINEFLRQGGILKIAWVIDSNQGFHNVIQIGNMILDVSVDNSFSSTDKKVFLYPHIDQSPFRNMSSFEDMATVMEMYWGYTVFPNIYFPWLAPVYPILAIQKNKGIRIESHSINLLWPNMTTEVDKRLCGLSWRFLFNSSFSNRILPDKALDQLFGSGTYAQSIAHHWPTYLGITGDASVSMEIFWQFYGIENKHDVGRMMLQVKNRLQIYQKIPKKAFLGIVC